MILKNSVGFSSAHFVNLSRPPIPLNASRKACFTSSVNLFLLPLGRAIEIDSLSPNWLIRKVTNRVGLQRPSACSVACRPIP